MDCFKTTDKKYKVILIFIVILVFYSITAPNILFSQEYTTTVLNLPVPGNMLPASQENIPVIIKGVTIHPEDPLLLDFIIDTGESGLTGQSLEAETEKLIKYFLATLTVPENELWVNLSPYESDRIIPHGFSLTEMGRDLLAQDYLLKQLSATMMYPEESLGTDFWNNVRERAYVEYGIEDIPLNTFTKVWIVPDEAVVYEYSGSAYVIHSHLKILLEEDYIALENNTNEDKFGMASLENDQLKGVSKVTSEVIREIIIPEIEHEVNNGKTFNVLRQIYSSMILAVWYKYNLRESLLGQVYVDKNKTSGIDNDDKEINKKIYNQYLKAFEKGVYDYIREDYDPYSQSIIPRKYFSGGGAFEKLRETTRVVKGPPGNLTKADKAMLTRAINPSIDGAKNIKVSAQLLENPKDKAMLGCFSRASRFTKKVFEEENIPEQDKADLEKVEKIIGDEEGFEIFGGNKNPIAYKALKELTGSGLIAHRKGVYLPEQDSHLSIDFARIVKRETFFVVTKKQGENKKKLRALVIGTGTGIDALTIFKAGKQGLLDVEIDAVDVNEDAIMSTRFNFDLFNGENNDLLPNDVRLKLFTLGDKDLLRVFTVSEELNSSLLEGIEPYDIIVFNAPDALPKDQVQDASGNIQMDIDIFTKIIDKVRDKLMAKDGVAIIGNHNHIPMNAIFRDSYVSYTSSSRLSEMGIEISDPARRVTFKIQNDKAMLGDERLTLDNLVKMIIEEKGADEAYTLIHNMDGPMEIEVFKQLIQRLFEKVQDENKLIESKEAPPYGVIASQADAFLLKFIMSSTSRGITREMIDYANRIEKVLTEDIGSPAFEFETFDDNTAAKRTDGMREALTKQIAKVIWETANKIVELDQNASDGSKLIEISSMLLKTSYYSRAVSELGEEGMSFDENDVAFSLDTALKRIRTELIQNRAIYSRHIKMIILLGLLSIEEDQDNWMQKPLSIYTMFESESRALGITVDQFIHDLIDFANYYGYSLNEDIVNAKIHNAREKYFEFYGSRTTEKEDKPPDSSILGEKTEPVGGIDLNPDMLNLQIKRDRTGVPLPVFKQPLYSIDIDGFMPVIINMILVPNLPAVLGLSSDSLEMLELGFLLSE
ncbi:MAG: hypothetical protein A2Y06_06795 [Omnitrophica WOR_2 bacterium GWA2_37_7]|nr:MAG: hypothetical protein A2Y06_06795 [Omnitrophica WOR_2 bacterium GWA2_37_7]